MKLHTFVSAYMVLAALILTTQAAPIATRAAIQATTTMANDAIAPRSEVQGDQVLLATRAGGPLGNAVDVTANVQFLFGKSKAELLAGAGETARQADNGDILHSPGPTEEALLTSTPTKMSTIFAQQSLTPGPRNMEKVHTPLVEWTDRLPQGSLATSRPIGSKLPLNVQLAGTPRQVSVTETNGNPALVLQNFDSATTSAPRVVAQDNVAESSAALHSMLNDAPTEKPRGRPKLHQVGDEEIEARLRTRKQNVEEILAADPLARGPKGGKLLGSTFRTQKERKEAQKESKRKLREWKQEHPGEKKPKIGSNTKQVNKIRLRLKREDAAKEPPARDAIPGGSGS